jgi:peptidoglycan hydrolase CwlO-like protein
MAKREVKNIAKGTGKGFVKIVQMVKNRKIRKLEKEATKAQNKAQGLAHKIKTIQAKQDALLDVARYEKELEKLERETREQEAQLKDSRNSEIDE